LPETEIAVASTTDTQAAVDRAANAEVPSDDEVAAHAIDTRVVDESEKQDGSVLSYEHEHSSRKLVEAALLERMTNALAFEDAVRQQDAEGEPDESEPQAPPEAVPPAERGLPAPSQGFYERLGVLKQNPEVRELLESAGNISIPEVVAHEIARSPFGADIALILANDPGLAEKLAALPPAEAQRQTIEALGVLAWQAAHPQQPPQRPVSKAPVPIKPVGGHSTRSGLPPEEMSYADYRKWRDAQEKAKYARSR